MTFLPVVEREMNLLARRKGTYWARTGTALASLLTLGWLLAVTASSSFLALGQSIFLILSLVGFGYALAAGIQGTADCISEEKREGTLGLLFLTDLKGHDVVLGKLSATSLSAAYALLAILPMISLGLLIGGVSIGQVTAVAGILINTLFLSLGIGVFVSTLSQNERKAVFAAAVVLFLLTLGPFALAMSKPGLFEEFSWISPLYPILSIHFKAAAGGFGFKGTYLPSSIALHHVMGWLCLLGSCHILPRLINDVPQTRFARIRAAYENFARGTRERRKAYRAELLDRNAFLWLVSRENAKRRFSWALVALFVALYLWVLVFFPNLFFDLPVTFGIILTIHSVLKLWLASEVCHQLIQDRRSGALELLLTTPLSVRAIARGQSLSLRQIFQGPLVALCLFELLLAGAALYSQPMRPPPADRALTLVAAITTLVVDFWALQWVGLWRSLWGKSIERVLFSVMAWVLGVPWLIFASVYALLAMASHLTGFQTSYRSLLLVWWGINLAWPLCWGLPARLQFLKFFRACAAKQPDGKAPRVEDLQAEQITSPDLDMALKPFRTSDRAPWREIAVRTWRKHWVASGIILILTLAMVAVLGRRLYWSHALDREIARVRSTKMPLSLPEIEAYVRPGPGLKDAGQTLLAAGIPAIENDLATFWYPMLNTGARPWPTPGRELAPVLARNQEHLQAFWNLTNHTSFTVPLDMSGAPVSRLPLNYSILASLDYLAAEAEDDHDRAFRDLSGLITFARLLRHCPWPPAQAWANHALSCFSTVLGRRHSLPDRCLKILAAQLEHADCDEILPETVGIARAYLLANSDEISGVRGFDSQPEAAQLLRTFFVLTGSHQKDVWAGLRAFESGIQASALPYPERWERYRLWITLQPWDPSLKQEPFEKQALRMIANNYQTHAFFTRRLKLLQAAIAVLRYQREFGRYPEALEKVAPSFLPDVPSDPLTSEPFSFRESGGPCSIFTANPSGISFPIEITLQVESR